MDIYLSLITIPSQHADIAERITREVEAERKALVPPKSYSAPKQQEWTKTKNDELNVKADKLLRATALDGSVGEIWAIAFSIDGEIVQVLSPLTPGIESELDLLIAFVDSVGEAAQPLDEAITWVGHGVRSFTLRFLFQRMVINRTNPGYIDLAHDVRPGDSRVFDTMEEWVGAYGGKSISLDKLCGALGVEAESIIPGDKVWDYIEGGRAQDVLDHLVQQVERTIDVADLLRFRGIPQPHQFDERNAKAA